MHKTARLSACGRPSIVKGAMLLVGAALEPAVRVLLLLRHTYIHAAFMVRMLVVPISLAPLAWYWPVVLGPEVAATERSKS